jgi:predicted Zn-dependent protease
VNTLEIAERALSFVAGGEAEVFVGAERSGFARYAGSEVHQPTLVDNAVVQLRVVEGRRRAGVAATNRTDDDGLAELARRAADVVANASDDPDVVPPAQSAEHPEVGGYDESTAALEAGDQARLAAAAIGAAGDLALYGYFTTGVCEAAIAATSGLRASQRMTDMTCLALAATDGAAGYAMRTSWRAGEIDPAGVAREAAAKAERTHGAVAVEPGHYRAVLEPYALADLLTWFSFDSLNGLGFLEERSYLTGRVGEHAFDAKAHLARRRPRPRRPAARLRLRGDAEAARTARRGGRHPRPCLGPGDRRPRRSSVHGACAARHVARLRADADEPGRGPGRGRVDGRARGAGRRRHLHHAAPLPERRQPARGGDHGDDA